MALIFSGLRERALAMVRSPGDDTVSSAGEDDGSDAMCISGRVRDSSTSLEGELIRLRDENNRLQVHVDKLTALVMQMDMEGGTTVGKKRLYSMYAEGDLEARFMNFDHQLRTQEGVQGDRKAGVGRTLGRVVGRQQETLHRQGDFEDNQEDQGQRSAKHGQLRCGHGAG